MLALFLLEKESKMQNFCNWAVVAQCQAKNNGVWEPFERLIATFTYPYNADDFMEKCLPKENRECFYKKYLPDLCKEKEVSCERNGDRREPSSRARAEGICTYKFWTTEELINEYSWELKRINKEDAEQTKKLIRDELKRRFADTLRLLDDEQTRDNPAGTYRYLLGVDD